MDMALRLEKSPPNVWTKLKKLIYEDDFQVIWSNFVTPEYCSFDKILENRIF